MKRLLLIMFAIVFPVLFVFWWAGVIVWQISKYCFLAVKRKGLKYGT